MRLGALAGLVLAASLAHAWGGADLLAPPAAAWVQVPGQDVTACAGSVPTVGQLVGPGCVLGCLTDGACATFVRTALLAPAHFRVAWKAWNQTIVWGQDTDGLYCTFIGDMADGRITVYPDPGAGPAGIMNTQEDEGQFCSAP